MRRNITCRGAPRARPPSRSSSADEVVRETGWVFNNDTGSDLSLAEFVETGDHETLAYLTAFGLGDDPPRSQTLVEIGSGIGRMTASFTRLFARVVACDLDAAFLERCRETVAQFGRPDAVADQPRRRRSHARDAPTTPPTSRSATSRCSTAITTMRWRLTPRPCGSCAPAVTWRSTSAPGRRATLCCGRPARSSARCGGSPSSGRRSSRHRTIARLGWQANRLSPTEVMAVVGSTA